MTKAKRKTPRRWKSYPRFLQLTNGQLATHDPHMLILNSTMSTLNLKTSRVAADAGVSPSTISKWRHMQVRRPSHVTLMSVAIALGYDISLKRYTK